jgi:hypothetical protein
MLPIITYPQPKDLDLIGPRELICTKLNLHIKMTLNAKFSSVSIDSCFLIIFPPIAVYPVGYTLDSQVLTSSLEPEPRGLHT